MAIQKGLEPYRDLIDERRYDSLANYYERPGRGRVFKEIDGIKFYFPNWWGEGIHTFDEPHFGHIRKETTFRAVEACPSPVECYVNALKHRDFPVCDGYPPRLCLKFATKGSKPTRNCYLYLACLSCGKPASDYGANGINDYLKLSSKPADVSFLDDFMKGQ